MQLVRGFGEIKTPQPRKIPTMPSKADGRLSPMLQTIDGLWSIVFGTFLNSGTDTLYFTAGPNQQQNGLFGKIRRAALR
jgi:hypothetical protein